MSDPAELYSTLDHFAAGAMQLLAPGLLVAAIATPPAVRISRRLTALALPEAPPLLFSLAFCGYVIGAIGGNSASPIAAPVITGLVGIVGTLVAYLHSKESTKASGLRTVSSVGLVLLLSSVLIGLISGGSYKRQFEPGDRNAELKQMLIKELLVPTCVEEFKRALDQKTIAPSKDCQELRQSAAR